MSIQPPLTELDIETAGSGFYEGFSKEKQDKMDMTSMLNELLANNVPVHVALIDGGWCEADDWSDIMAYENELNNNNSWIHNWK